MKVTSCSSIILFTIAIALTAHGQSKRRTAANDPKVIFFDDFSTNELDRSKWNVVVTGFTVNNEQQAYIDSSATIYLVKNDSIEGSENGMLVIEPRYTPGFLTPEGKTFDFISGRINTRSKVEFTYGVASARIRMTEGSGLWPAFWALGNGKWPDIGEIDIMEYVGEPDWTSVALHGPGYSGETPLVNKIFFTEEDATSWHVYSVEWKKDVILFKVDDVLIYRATRPMVEHYGAWVFDNSKYLILNFALGGAYPFKTNGIEKPYHGIPQSTVDLIKNGEAKFFVDWVKITKID